MCVIHTRPSSRRGPWLFLFTHSEITYFQLLKTRLPAPTYSHNIRGGMAQKKITNWHLAGIFQINSGWHVYVIKWRKKTMRRACVLYILIWFRVRVLAHVVMLLCVMQKHNIYGSWRGKFRVDWHRVYMRPCGGGGATRGEPAPPRETQESRRTWQFRRSLKGMGHLRRGPCRCTHAGSFVALSRHMLRLSSESTWLFRRINRGE